MASGGPHFFCSTSAASSFSSNRLEKYSSWVSSWIVRTCSTISIDNWTTKCFTITGSSRYLMGWNEIAHHLKQNQKSFQVLYTGQQKWRKYVVSAYFLARFSTFISCNMRVLSLCNATAGSHRCYYSTEEKREQGVSKCNCTWISFVSRRFRFCLPIA